MASLDHARIASLVSNIEDQAQRVADLAETRASAADDNVAGALYEAERSLRMAGRALDRALAMLRD